MTTTAAAENAAGQSGEKVKEKVEKRRALGRGLESLLPGPRMVEAAPRPIATSVSEEDARAGRPRPHEPAPNEALEVSPENISASASSQPVPGHVEMIQAVAEEELEKDARTSRSRPHESAAYPTQDSGESITILAQAESRIPGNLVVNLEITDIDQNPFQTRYVGKDDALEELTNSIKANGVLQPIVVRPAEEEGRYILILGERRLHASKLAGKMTVPAIVRRVSEQQAAEMTIIENLQREDLKPLEQAEAFRLLSQEFKLTQAQIGERVGLSRESVANYMRLLRLPVPTMELLARGEINFAMAKELLKLEDNDQIEKAAAYIVKHGMTFDQVERLVWRMMGVLDPVPGMPGQERKKGAGRWVDPNVRAAQLELERLLGVRVRIRDRKGKGKIVIEYSTVDDYERVVGMLRGRK